MEYISKLGNKKDEVQTLVPRPVPLRIPKWKLGSTPDGAFGKACFGGHPRAVQGENRSRRIFF